MLLGGGFLPWCRRAGAPARQKAAAVRRLGGPDGDTPNGCAVCRGYANKGAEERKKQTGLLSRSPGHRPVNLQFAGALNLGAAAPSPLKKEEALYASFCHIPY